MGDRINRDDSVHEVGTAQPRRRADAVRNREAVMEAAIHVLAERPQASMRDIADASHLGRTTVYRHFTTRDELVEALLERVIEQSRDTFAAAASAEGSAGEVLRRMARELVALSERYRFLQQHRGLRAERLLEPSEEASGPWAKWLTDAQARGELRADMPVTLMLALQRSMAIATADEVAAGRISADEAGRLLGDVLVAAFSP